MLFQIGGLKIHAYPACLSIAFVLGTLLAVRQASREQPPIYMTTIAGLCGFVGALLGAKVFWYLQFRPGDVWRAIFVWESGLVYYGGLVGGILGVVLYCRITRLPLLRVGDVAIVFVPLGQAITRIGCFLNGCCWGKPASEMVPWAVTFPRYSLAYKQQLEDELIPPGASAPLPVHPTQLYMMVGLLIIFIFMYAGLSKKRFNGAMLVVYCFLYGILRFTVEHFRGDSARSIWVSGPYPLTVSQAISLALIAGALLTIIVVRRFPLSIKPRELHPVRPDNDTQPEQTMDHTHTT